MSVLRGPSDDVIPALAVDDLLRTVRLGLEQLEVELQQAQLEIAQLEAELATHVDLQPGDERIDSARVAIEGVAVGAQEHLGKVLAAAHAHAEARVAAAEAEALWIVQEAREEAARALVEPLGVGDPIPPADAVAVAAPAPTALPVAGLTRWVMPPQRSPLPPASADAGVPPTARQPGIVAAPAEAPASPSAPPTSPEVAAPHPTVDSEFWAEERGAAAKVGSYDGVLSALLPMVAVLIVLVVILAWIG